MQYQHQAVLYDEVVEGLQIDPAGIYIDATFGRGGHSLAILNHLGAQGKLLALDKDPEAVAVGRTGIFLDPRFEIVHDSFSHLGEIAQRMNYAGKVSGILMDIGVSSPQLEDPQRGFSFMREGPLDMRMNPEQGIDAATWLNRAKENEISDVLWQFGEERYSRRIAKTIVNERKNMPLETTTQLAKIIERCYPRREAGKNPATRSFQAIRIYINNEMDELKNALLQSLDVLKIGGRLCVISFHSLEDRIVKRFIQQWMRAQDDQPRRLRKMGKLIRPSREEVRQNKRARSARMRIAEKIV